MEHYDEIMTYTILTISKIYAVYGFLIIAALIVCLLLKKKFKSNKPIIVLTVVFACTVASYLILTVPRIADLKNDEYIRVKDATLVIDQFNNNPKGSNVMFFGYAHIMPENGKSIMVDGIDFFDLSGIEDIDTTSYCYDIVYAKYSRQLIAMEKQSDKLTD